MNNRKVSKGTTIYEEPAQEQNSIYSRSQRSANTRPRARHNHRVEEPIYEESEEDSANYSRGHRAPKTTSHKYQYSTTSGPQDEEEDGSLEFNQRSRNRYRIVDPIEEEAEFVDRQPK